jgi:hypothetical protein
MLDHRLSQEVGKGFPLETCRTIPGRNDSDNFHKIKWTVGEIKCKQAEV